jgi:MFS family permease
MVAPALPAMAHDLNVTNSFEQSMILSIFVLAYAVGPLFLGPFSEIFGRIHVLQLANLVFLAFNLACGFAQSKGEMLGFRFMAGLGGSAPLAVSLCNPVRCIADQCDRLVEGFLAIYGFQNSVVKHCPYTQLDRC